MRRRNFMGGIAAGAVATHALTYGASLGIEPRQIAAPHAGEDIFAYIDRQAGKFDRDLYLKILGHANEFKEGDEIVGVAALDEAARTSARTLLANTRVADMDANPPLLDELYAIVRKTTSAARPEFSNWTLGQLKSFLLSSSEADIHAMKDSLSSDCIACVVKLMSNDELIAVGAKVFNALPNSRIGAKGYLGARLQPNSPTDNIDDIRCSPASSSGRKQSLVTRN